jgi:hypothetical protein
MPYRLTVWFFLLSLASFSCKENKNRTNNYESLQFDSNKINIFKWDTSLSMFLKYSEALPLTNNDIKLTDSLLFNAVDTFNKTISKGLFETYNQQIPIDSFAIDLAKYKRQYFPYIDNNGQKVIQIICFSRPFPEWRIKIYDGRFDRGIAKFSLKVNLSEIKYHDFSIGGFG